ncbi:leukotoxin LktA family filamentous adhesin, partial [bacterium]
ITKHTYAFIGNGATVRAAASNIYEGLTVHTGEFGESFADPSGGDGEVSPVDIDNPDADKTGDESYSKLRVASPITRTSFRGVAVTAVNSDDIGAYGVGAGLAGTGAFQISVTVNVLTAHTWAYIDDNAQINTADSGEGADQSVLVAAGNNYGYLGIAGAVAIAGTFAATPGAEIDVVVLDTKAYIGKSAVVQAVKDIEVRAESAEDILSIAVAISGSGTVAIAGSVSVVVVDSSTYAYIDNNAVVAAGGNILISAADATDVDTVSGSVAVGISGGGVGAGIGVTVITKDTRAYIGQGAEVDAAGNSSFMTVYNGELDSDTGAFGTTDSEDDVRGLAVVAVSSENIFSIVASGAGGLWVGISGAVAVQVVDSDTRAYIEALAKINTGGEPTGENAHQDVYVTAANDVTTLVIVGALGAGAAGIGGGTDIGVIRNDVTAFIAGSDVRAKNDIVVNALADREIQSYTISAAGGVVGVAAAVSVYVLGGNMDSTYTVSEEVNGDDQETTTTANALTDGSNNSIGASTETQLAGSGLTDVLAGFITPKDDDSEGEKDAAAGGTQASTAFSSNAPGTPITTATGATVGSTSTLGPQTIPRGGSAFGGG